ncbi:MAG: Gfo/Idh/MocA family oxidoreductase [Candidatus Omnitrophica bacterium]|nr:Gfo/Idh/MocA family oxidoreductase [Candidatus Omnitrophota bacterium]
MERIKVGVVGVGHLGSIHARLYKEIPSCSLAAICDINQQQLEQASRTLDVPGYREHRQLLGKVDAVSIASPTADHYALTRDFLKSGVHVLVEKPFTTTVHEANALIKLARKHRCLLTVGHVERFNSAFRATHKIIRRPRFIECHRLSPFPNRSLDVGVVLDIMIHDIDIILGLVASPIRKIESIGVSVLTPFEDIANTRITFADGCVANLTASRVSDEPLRKIRIFQKDTYISLDYKEASAFVYRKANGRVSREELPIEKEQPLRKELEFFLECIQHHHTPLITGEIARDALKVALKVRDQICL